MNMVIRWGLIAMTILLCVVGVQAEQIEWSGYLRNDIIVTDRHYGIVTGHRLGNYLRLRLDLDASINDHVAVLATPQFISRSGDMLRDPYLGAELLDEYAVSLSRAQVDFFWDQLQITLGKQRLKMSTAYFYSPLDIFNPPDYTEPKSERNGVNAARFTAYLTGFAGVRGIFVPDDTWEQSPKAFRSFATVGDFEMELSYLEPGYDHVKTVGIDASGSIYDLGLYCELAGDVDSLQDELNPRGAVGLNYGWRDGPNITLEYYRDQRGAVDIQDYEYKPYALGKRLTLGRDMAGGIVVYNPHPMWLTSLAGMMNIQDESYYVNPAVTWSVFADVELMAEADYFHGDELTEFYFQHSIYRLQLMAYF